MRATQALLAKGMFGRSVDEFKRFAQIAINQEALTVPTAPYPLIDLRNPGTIEECKTMSDADIGGYSEAFLDHIAYTQQETAHARFHGNISTDLPRNRPEIQRSGYAAWRNRDRRATIFGRSVWDIDPYAYLGLRIKSDGRKYFVNVQTDSLVPTDLHQHRLYALNPGKWETVLIKWSDFVRTNHGVVVEPQAEMLRQRVKSVGIGLIDRVPGPFDLRISQVWATNDSEGGLPDEVGEKAQLIRKELEDVPS